MSTANKYDQFSYPSAPFDYSHCRRLETVGTLFGMQPTPITQARVLELGCGDGSNLIPQAESYPESTFVGIDYAQMPIEQGQKVIRAVGLANIELRAENVMDLDPSCGPFDYIIAHGLYSWIPPAVQAKTLELLPQLLAPQGVAFVSYNTLPGWNFKRTVRELMLVHTHQITEPQEKVNQSRAILRWVASAAKEESPYRQFLEKEMKILNHAPDGYIYHEHLEDQNEAIYFREFLSRITNVSLQYLGEAELAYMYWHDIPADQQRDLAQVPGEVAEQLTDFIRNRAFRKTLLCHENVKLHREPQLEVLHSLYFSMENKAKMEGVDLAASEPMEMQIGDNLLKIPEPLFQASLVELCDIYPGSLVGSEVGPRALQRLRSAGLQNLPSDDVARDEVTKFLWRLASSGVLEVVVHPTLAITHVTERPMVSPLVRYHAEHNPYTTNRRHMWVKLDDISRRLLYLLDGTRTATEVVSQVAAEIAEGKLKSPDPEEKRSPEQIAQECLNTLAHCSLLTA